MPPTNAAAGVMSAEKLLSAQSDGAAAYHAPTADALVDSARRLLDSVGTSGAAGLAERSSGPAPLNENFREKGVLDALDRPLLQAESRAFATVNTAGVSGSTGLAPEDAASQQTDLIQAQESAHSADGASSSSSGGSPGENNGGGGGCGGGSCMGGGGDGSSDSLFACLDNLSFLEFHEKKMAVAQAAEGAKKGGGTSVGKNMPAQFDSVFKSLMDKIKTLEIHRAIADM